jgi:hypothetical protein
MKFGKLTKHDLRENASAKTFIVVNGTYTLKSVTGDVITIAVGSAPANASSEISLSINEYLSHFANKNYGNTVLGAYSQYSRTTGAGNTSAGWYSMHKNIIGNGNSTIGWFSLYNNTIGDANVAIGAGSGYTNDGNNNIFVGVNSGYKNIGNENSFIGSNSGYNNTGNNNIFIGANVDYKVNSVNNSVHIGDSSINLLRCSEYAITTPADSQDMSGVAPLSIGFEFIDKLKPVTFSWTRRDGNKKGIKSCGLIGQDVKSVLVSNDMIHLLNDNDPANLEVAYSNLIPILIKACQQYSARIIEANIKIAKLETQTAELKTLTTKLETDLKTQSTKSTKLETDIKNLKKRLDAL